MVWARLQCAGNSAFVLFPPCHPCVLACPLPCSWSLDIAAACYRRQLIVWGLMFSLFALRWP